MVNLLFDQSNFFYRIDIRMKLFKTEEHAIIAKILNNMASIYSGVGQKQRALEMNEKVYSRER